MTTNDISAILCTEDHIIKAQIDASGQRLLLLLNNSATEFLQMRNVQIYHRKNNQLVAQVPEAVIRKENLILAIPTGSSHEAPQKRLDSFVSKKEHEVLMLAHGYEIQGHLQVKTTKDPVYLLCHEMGDFLPVPQGTVSSEGVQLNQQKAQVVIVNQAYISLIHLGDLVKHDCPTQDIEGSDPLTAVR